MSFPNGLWRKAPWDSGFLPLEGATGLHFFIQIKILPVESEAYGVFA